jgi:hypothetical protein
MYSWTFFFGVPMLGGDFKKRARAGTRARASKSRGAVSVGRKNFGCRIATRKKCAPAPAARRELPGIWLRHVPCSCAMAVDGVSANWRLHHGIEPRALHHRRGRRLLRVLGARAGRSVRARCSEAGRRAARRPRRGAAREPA